MIKGKDVPWGKTNFLLFAFAIYPRGEENPEENALLFVALVRHFYYLRGEVWRGGKI